MKSGRARNYRRRNLTFVIMVMLVVCSLVLSAYALRHNNQTMERLRTAVFIADQEGQDDQSLEEALQALRDHVVSHMNTDLQPDKESKEPPIQLPYKYYRDTLLGWQNHIMRIDINLLDDLSTARRYCETEEFTISERLNCLVDQTREVEGMPPAPVLAPDFYSFNFVSPSWSPDLAGFSLVAFVISVGALIVRLFIV